jgi:hypothetical protein
MSDLVTLLFDLPKDVLVPFCGESRNEERAMDPVFFEKVENPRNADLGSVNRFRLKRRPPRTVLRVIIQGGAFAVHIEGDRSGTRAATRPIALEHHRLLPLRNTTE